MERAIRDKKIQISKEVEFSNFAHANFLHLLTRKRITYMQEAVVELSRIIDSLAA